MTHFLTKTLIFLPLFMLPQIVQAENLVRYEKMGPCKTRLTVPIEIFGAGATSDFAREIEANVRDQWSGPSAEDAGIIGSKMGLEVDWFGDEENAKRRERSLKKYSDAVDPRVNSDGTQELVDNTGQIRGIYDDYIREFDADPACIQGECCALKIMADVKRRSRDDSPTPGYYQIEIVDDPTFRSFMWGDKVARSGIENPDPNNADHWQIDPTVVKGSGGVWSNDAVNNAAAHEVGHLMGLNDQYTDIKNSAGKTIGSFQHHGHRHDIMAQSRAFPFSDALSQLLEYGGIECDEETCCPKPVYDRFWQDFSQTVITGGDAVAACDKAAIRNLLRQLHSQRRNLELAKGIPPHRKITLAVAIDAEIAKLKAALKVDCPRPVTSDVIPATGITTGGNYTPGEGQTRPRPPISIGVDTESSTWCEYGLDTPSGGTLIPSGPGITTPPGGTPTTTGGGTTPPESGSGLPGTPTNPGEGTPTEPGSGTPPEPGGSTTITPPGEGVPPGTPTIPGGNIPGLPSGGSTDDPDEEDPKDSSTPSDDDPEDTPEIPTTVIVKAKSSVLEGVKTTKTSAIQGQRIKLIPDATKSPALPSDPGAMRTQIGSNEDPAQCTTNNTGECEIGINNGLQFLGLKDPSTLASQYDFEVETPQASGATFIGNAPLSEEDRKKVADQLKETGLKYTDLKFNDYKIGDRWITSLGYGAKLDYDLDYKLDLGLRYKIEPDLCRTIQPGPSLGTSTVHLSADSGEIPSATLPLSALTMQEKAR